MSAKEYDDLYCSTKRILIDRHCIVECGCGDYYWLNMDEGMCYAIVFSELKKKNEFSVDNKEVREIIKSIVSVAGSNGDVCPHCGWKFTK